MKCTWVDCKCPGSKPQLDKSGKLWASLCVSHNAQLERAIESGTPHALISAWVKAQGGAKEAADRFLSDLVM